MDHTSHSGGDPKNSVYRSPGGTPSRYGDIRRMLDDGRVMDAELLLDSISATARDGEWHHLKGRVLQQKGRHREAALRFAEACRLSPENETYRQATNAAKGQSDDGWRAIRRKIRQFFRF